MDKKNVEAMCDSIVSGFPIGSFLLWSPFEKYDLTLISKGHLGSIRPPTNAKYTSLILDGQNRLATLAWMMEQNVNEVKNISGIEAETWLSREVLVLDFETKSIIFVPNEEANNGLSDRKTITWTF